MTARRGNIELEVRIVEDPAGRPAVLLQLPDGYVTMHDPAKVRQLAAVLTEESDKLELIIQELL